MFDFDHFTLQRKGFKEPDILEVDFNVIEPAPAAQQQSYFGSYFGYYGN
jgi:hypothetical protein